MSGIITIFARIDLWVLWMVLQTDVGTIRNFTVRRSISPRNINNQLQPITTNYNYL